MLSKKEKMCEKKIWQKVNKKKKLKIKVLKYELLAFTLLSNASFFEIRQSFKSLFMNSSYVKFGRHLSLFSLLVHLIISLRIGASAELRWICPNHLKRYYTSFSSTGATPSLLCMLSFRTQSLLVWSQIHHSMRISATLSC
jgi:hypothetical protein